ncbi:hypothetical protein V6N12_074529 [Hibiscus sabdariffa]|uniref:Uncharacterized protein n=1 Tax=Hibiscus sabdariffa TaxID=183260 RepID=A0ABR2ALZ7_9ROSI
MTQGTNTDVSSGHNNVSTGLQLSYVQQIPNDSQGDNSQYHGSGRSYSSYSQKIDSPAQVYNHSVGFLTSHVPNSQFTQIPSAQCVPATPYNSQFTFVTPSQHGFVSPVNQSVHSTVLVSEGFHQGGTPPAAGHQFASFAGGQAFQAAPSFLSPASVSFVASPGPVERGVPSVSQPISAGSTQVPGTILTTPVIDGSPTRQDGSCDDRFCGEEEVLVVPQSEQQLSEVVQEIEVSPSSLQEEDLVSLQQQEMVTPSQQEMTTQQEEILVAPCQQPLKDIREFGDLNQSDAYVSEQAVPVIEMLKNEGYKLLKVGIARHSTRFHQRSLHANAKKHLPPPMKHLRLNLELIKSSHANTFIRYNPTPKVTLNQGLRNITSSTAAKIET